MGNEGNVRLERVRFIGDLACVLAGDLADCLRARPPPVLLMARGGPVRLSFCLVAMVVEVQGDDAM
jgi:hypothetical protein